MGYYNSQYEDYYNGLKSRVKYSPRYNNSGSNNAKKSKMNYIVKRIIRDLAGVLALSVFVLGCKIIPTRQTKDIYNYSKQLLNKTYDYKALKQNLSNVDLKTVEDKAHNIIYRLQVNIPK